MEFQIKKLIHAKDYDGLRQALSQSPMLANEGIPFDDSNTTRAHPLHRICDAVFSGAISDEQGVEIAKIFLDHGANINGNELIEKQDTPLLAASSLHADKVALLYIDQGADINHQGCHGGTALHWAAWTGRPKVVEKLLSAHAQINIQSIDFKATALLWAFDGMKEGANKDRKGHLECIRLLLKAGADRNIPNAEGKTIFNLLEKEDMELRKLLNSA